jgi:hypothetical protein
MVHVRGPSVVTLLSNEMAPTPSEALGKVVKWSSVLFWQFKLSQQIICDDDREKKLTRKVNSSSDASIRMGPAHLHGSPGKC